MIFKTGLFFVGVLFPLLSVTLPAAPTDARILIMDDFEGYTNTVTMRTVWAGGNATLDPQAPGGGQAAAHDGGAMNNLSGMSVRPDARFNVLFSADFYDSGVPTDKRVTIVLKNASGDSIEFGFVSQAQPYALRLTGFATPTDWIPFDPAFRSVRGWHRFQAVVSITNTVISLDLHRDNTLDMALVFDGPAPEKPFKVVRFGGLPERQSPGGPVLIDNVQLAVIPSDGPIPDIAMYPPAIVPIAPDRPPRTVQSPDPSVPPLPPSEEHSPVLWWIVGALAVIIGLLGALLLTLRRNARSAASWAVATIPPSGPLVGPIGQNAVVTAELTDFAKQSLVQGLYTQRMALIEAQQRAQHDLAELEARLTGLQLPLQDRISAYEKRIAELEKQLESRSEEMQELTQVTLRLVRGKLEEEKERERLDGGRFN